jgi:hypothetical protein
MAGTGATIARARRNLEQQFMGELRSLQHWIDEALNATK